MTTKFPRAYAVVSHRRKGVEYPITIGPGLPIYWSRRVASSYASEFGGRVVPVTISEASKRKRRRNTTIEALRSQADCDREQADKAVKIALDARIETAAHEVTIAELRKELEERKCRSSASASARSLTTGR